MSDAVDDFRALKLFRQKEREAFGVKCPVCVEKLPRANAKILLPGQTCRAHKPHYRDTRPDLTSEDYEKL